MILVVFALTGTTVLLIKRPIVAYFSVDGTDLDWTALSRFVLSGSELNNIEFHSSIRQINLTKPGSPSVMHRHLNNRYISRLLLLITALSASGGLDLS